jgi:prolipoprotein diacylglyceryltransferase
LFELGPLKLDSYGVMIAVAALVGFWVLRLELGRRAGRSDAAWPLILAALVGGLVGARHYHVLENLGQATAAAVCRARASPGVRRRANVSRR